MTARELSDCSTFVLSRRAVDKVVILRKTLDGTKVANLTDAEMQAVKIAMQNGGLKMFQPNAANQGLPR